MQKHRMKPQKCACSAFLRKMRIFPEHCCFVRALYLDDRFVARRVVEAGGAQQKIALV
jgi:hypothetical protein